MDRAPAEPEVPRRMIPPPEAEGDLELFGAVVGEKMGLHFSPERRAHLWRAVRNLARESAGADPRKLLASLARGSLSSEMMGRLAPHLTVGETYFFRERRTLEAFRRRVLPPYLDRGSLRVWCAGCSSGEEPYTVAMLVHEELPPGRPMALRILGTDINPQVLEKARQGVYSRWSFRGVPEGVRNRYFDPVPPHSFSVKPRFRSEVSFARHNLVDEEGSPWGDDGPVDVIFCRNVLIYLSPPTIAAILDRFHRLLAPGGWLLVAPCETSMLMASCLESVIHDGATLYRKPSGPFLEVAPDLEKNEREPLFPSEGSLNLDDFDEGSSGRGKDVLDDREESPGYEGPWDDGDHAPGTFASFKEDLGRDEGEDEGEKESEATGPDDLSGVVSVEGSLSAVRALANQGKYAEARERCRDALASDKANPRAHYLLALIHQEMGDPEEALRSLRSALFLDPDFVAAHHALGTLTLSLGRLPDARRHFRNARRLLILMPEEGEVPESGGMTARHLREILDHQEAGGGLGS